MTDKGSSNSDIWDFWSPILLTFSLYIGLRTYIAEARYIPSGSMLPGLQINDRLLIEKITFRIRKPTRGDIIVFNSPYSFDPLLSSKVKGNSLSCLLINLPIINVIPGLSSPICDAYIKRIVAISGDKVLVNSAGNVYINGVIKSEPYVKNYCNSRYLAIQDCPSIDTIVPEGHVFVLGDNRGNSWDGRFWPGDSFLPTKEIIGRAIWRFWPINRIGDLS